MVYLAVMQSCSGVSDSTVHLGIDQIQYVEQPRMLIMMNNI